MLGCRKSAKNTLPKNYLCFAERLGVQIHPERTVTSIRPLGRGDGSDGYAVTSERSGAWLRKDRRRITARGVVVAAGALGHQPAARALQGRRRPAADLRPARPARAHEQRVADGGHRAGGPRLEREHLDHREHPPRSRQPCRGRHLRHRRRPLRPRVHAAHARRDATHAAAEDARPDRPAPASTSCASTDPRGWSRRSLLTGIMQTLDGSLQLVPKRGLAAAPRSG